MKIDVYMKLNIFPLHISQIIIYYNLYTMWSILCYFMKQLHYNNNLLYPQQKCMKLNQNCFSLCSLPYLYMFFLLNNWIISNLLLWIIKDNNSKLGYRIIVLFKSLTHCKRRNKGNFTLKSNSNKIMLCEGGGQY